MEYARQASDPSIRPLLILFPDNDFLTLNLTKSWQISAPAYTGLPRPPGPPPVANGYLWASYDSLYLYGGEFSDDPIMSPVPFSLWQYQIEMAQWSEHNDPTTSAGVNAPATGSTVNRAAEGAGFSVAALGRGWYFGGHEDRELDFKRMPTMKK